MSEILEALTHEFIERDDAPARIALDYFKSASPAALANTLRHHGDDPVVGGPTIDRRASFDALLSFYGLIEIGCFEGLIELDDGFAKRAKRHLAHPALRTYYEEHYPLLLPQLLRRRLAGDPLKNPVAQPFSIAYQRYLTFLDLRHMLEDPDAAPAEWTDVEQFWWLLDDGETEDGYVIDDLVEAFSGSASTAREALLGEDDTCLHDAIRGLYQFVRFADELQRFLEVQSSVVASVYWHQYGYWFDRMGNQLLHVLVRVLAQIEVGDRSSDDILRRVGRLTSGRYAWLLREASLGEAMWPWVHEETWPQPETPRVFRKGEFELTRQWIKDRRARTSSILPIGSHVRHETFGAGRVLWAGKTRAMVGFREGRQRVVPVHDLIRFGKT